MTKNLVIAGKPGVGKTTLIKEATLPYRAAVGGFYTEAILETGKRMGFRLKSFDGREGVFASKTSASPVRLNKYGIDLNILEETGVRALREASAARKIVVIDEIGAMEAFLDAFREAVLACLNGPCPVLATVRAGAKEFAGPLGRMADTRLVELTRRDFQEVKREVGLWLESKAAR